mgnify:CR=1 FL=1
MDPGYKKGINYALLLLGAMVIGGLVVLLNHEKQVRFLLYVERGYQQGCDWEWADPGDLGQPRLMSVPQPRDLHTGEIMWTPLLG